MMKKTTVRKLFSSLMAFILVFSLAAPAYASPVDKSRFMKALSATYAEINRECEIINKYSDSSALLSKIMENPYEFLIDFAMTYKDTYSDEEQTIKFKNDMFADNTTGKMLDKISLDLGDMLGVAFKIDVQLYADGDKLAVHVPALSNKYYYITTDTTAEQWNNSAAGEIVTMTDETMDQIKAYIRLFKTQNEALAKPLPDDFTKKYIALTAKYLAMGEFSSEGQKFVEAARGMISTEKLTCAISPELAAEYIEELADMISNDGDLYDFLDKAYAGQNTLAGYDMSNDLVSEIMYALYSINLEDFGLTYSLYIGKSGYALRQEVMLSQSIYGGDELRNMFALNTTGTDYLINETELSMSNVLALSNGVAGGYSREMTVSCVGNNVPKNGVFESKIIIRNKNNSDGYESMNTDGDLLLNFKWDTTRKEDNFTLSATTDRSLFAEEVRLKDTMTIKGDVVLDKDANQMLLNLKDSKWWESAGVTFNLKLMFAPTDASVIAIPADKSVNILDLSADDIDRLFATAEAKFGF